MLEYHFNLHHHIINIDFDALAQLRLEHSRHHPLINRPCVLQTERHYLVVIIPSRYHEGCFLLILQGYWYLMIALEGI